MIRVRGSSPNLGGEIAEGQREAFGLTSRAHAHGQSPARPEASDAVDLGLWPLKQSAGTGRPLTQRPRLFRLRGA